MSIGRKSVSRKVAISDLIECDSLIYIVIWSISPFLWFIFHEIATIFDEMKTFHGLSNSPKDTLDQVKRLIKKKKEEKNEEELPHKVLINIAICELKVFSRCRTSLDVQCNQWIPYSRFFVCHNSHPAHSLFHSNIENFHLKNFFSFSHLHMQLSMSSFALNQNIMSSLRFYLDTAMMHRANAITQT